MAPLDFYLFGPPRLARAGQVIDISLRKALALLVYLAVTRQPHSRDALATLFWPENNQREARASTIRRGLTTIAPSDTSLGLRWRWAASGWLPGPAWG